MKKQMISKTIKRIYISKLIPALLFLIFTVFLIYQYPFQEILIPQRLNNINSILEERKSGQDFLEITVPDLFYTGYDEIRNSVKIGSYYYAFIDDTCIFFLLKNTSDTTLTSELKDVTIKVKRIEDSEKIAALREYFSADLLWTDEDLGKMSSTYIFSEPDAFAIQDYFLLVLLSIFIILTVVSIIVSFIFISLPYYSPFCKYLSNESSKRHALLTANDEYISSKMFCCGNTTIMKNYFLELDKYKVELIPLDQMIWIFKYSNISKLNGLSYTIVIHTTLGKVKIKNKHKFDADSILNYLEQNIPTIIIGYSKENERMSKDLSKNRNVSWQNLKEG